MAAKGRGRGIAAFTFNIEALGISRASLPEATLGPKPLFPDVEYKPVPLSSGEDEEYMLGLKQEMRCTMKRLPFNVTKPEEKAGDRTAFPSSVNTFTFIYLADASVQSDFQ
uniref:Uncharacterized protein n=1 Tax=Scleropages formosus TaxID=113540 RepID=A0A8C9S7V8_SCLFO